MYSTDFIKLLKNATADDETMMRRQGDILVEFNMNFLCFSNNVINQKNVSILKFIKISLNSKALRAYFIETPFMIRSIKI